MVNSKKIGLVIVDVWNLHWSEKAMAQTAVIAPKINELCTALRTRGHTIIHAAHGVYGYYRYNPYQKALHIKQVPVPNKPATIYSGRPGMEYVKGMYPVWSMIHPSISIAYSDYMTTHAPTLRGIVKEENIKILALCGLHANLCLLDREVGIIEVSRWEEIRCYVLSDLTDVLCEKSNKVEVLKYVENYCDVIDSSELWGL